MHLNSQSQIEYMSSGISSPGFVCWQKAKAGANTWLIRWDSANARYLLLQHPLNLGRVPLRCYLLGKVFHPAREPGAFLARFQILCGWSLETASAKAFCCNQNSQWPSSLGFCRGSRHWRTMEGFENLVLEEKMSRAVWKAHGGPGSSGLLTFPANHGKRRQQLSRYGEKQMRLILTEGFTSNPGGKRNVQKGLPRQQ